MSSPIRQSSDLLLVNQGLTLSATINGALQGSDIIVVFSHSNFTLNGANFTASDSQSQTIITDVNLIRAGTISTTALRVHNCNSGNHTITVIATQGNATDSYYGGCIFEVPGITGFDTGKQGTGTGASNTGPVQATTGTLSQASEWLLAFAYNENGQSGFSAPSTSGWGSISSIVTSSNLYKFAQQVTSSTSPVTANFGTLGANGNWDIVVLPYLISAVVPFPPMSLGGIGVQMCQ